VDHADIADIIATAEASPSIREQEDAFARRYNAMTDEEKHDYWTVK